MGKTIVMRKVSGNKDSARVTWGTSVAVEKESRREIICDMVNPFAEKESKAEVILDTNNAHSEKEIIRETFCDMIDPFAEKRNETKIIEHVTLNNATATSGNAVTEE